MIDDPTRSCSCSPCTRSDFAEIVAASRAGATYRDLRRCFGLVAVQVAHIKRRAGLIGAPRTKSEARPCRICRQGDAFAALVDASMAAGTPYRTIQRILNVGEASLVRHASHRGLPSHVHRAPTVDLTPNEVDWTAPVAELLDMLERAGWRLWLRPDGRLALHRPVFGTPAWVSRRLRPRREDLCRHLLAVRAREDANRHDARLRATVARQQLRRERDDESRRLGLVGAELERRQEAARTLQASIDGLLSETLPVRVSAHAEGRRNVVDAVLASVVATVRASLLPALATLAAPGEPMRSGGPHAS